MRVLPLITTAVVAAAFAAQAAPRSTELMVAQGWCRPAAAGMTGGGFLTLMNHGAGPATLVSVESAVARKVEIHKTSLAGGVASMERVEAGLVVPAGGSVRFAPGGHHLMLIGLSRTLKAGEKVPVTLVFADGRRVEAELSVQAAAPQAPASGHDHH